MQPENILFRTKNMDSDITIADFGLSKLVNDNHLLSTACGTPNYVGMQRNSIRSRTYQKQKKYITSLGHNTASVLQ
jgi:calcium/calmodulin-dependent protein kinase I